MSGFDAMRALIQYTFVPAIDFLDTIPLTASVSVWDMMIGFAFIACCITVLWRFGGFAVGRYQKSEQKSERDRLTAKRQSYETYKSNTDRLKSHRQRYRREMGR